MAQIKVRRLIICSLVLLAALRLSAANAQTADAFGVNSVRTHLEITGLETAGPPRILEGRILFTHKPVERTMTGRRTTRYVGIAFGHENFSRIHAFAHNGNGVYFLLYPIPSDGSLTTIRYRYVVDGLWLVDPENPNQVEDVAGIAISFLDVPSPKPDRDVLPRVESGGRTLFAYFGTPGRIVRLSGSFTNWDPFMHRLEESAPGEYRITLRLPPGTHEYYFVVNGRRILDPSNAMTAYDREGNSASRITIPPEVAVGR